MTATLVIAAFSHGAEIFVPADFAAIQDAIAAPTTLDGDEIIVAPGTYGERLDFLGKAITVRGSDGPANTIVDGGATGSTVLFTNGEGRDSVLDGLTIRGGNATFGGGIRIDGSGPTIIRCVVRGNRATLFGGGIHCKDGDPRLEDSSFEDNIGNLEGGGLHNAGGGAPLIVNCVFTSNTSLVGGAINNEDGASPVIIGTRFVGNEGGGVRCAGGSRAALTDCTFVANSGTLGGGLLVEDSAPTITACSFFGNTATQIGGAVFNIASGPRFVNCVFSGNAAATAGAMANLDGSAPLLINCTIADNLATQGGGLHHAASFPLVVNSILWGNTPDQINELSGAAAVHFCDVEGGWTGAGSNNIDLDPAFTDASGPDGRPGTGDEELHLQSISPCLDRGDSSAVPPGITTDRAGNPRFVDATGLGRAIVDLGAFEYAPPPCPADFDRDGVVGFTDLLSTLGFWGPCRPPCPFDLDGSGDVGFVDLLTVLEAWGPCGSRP
ncbi:MAG: hypothetical protein HKO59_03575 [Phycisphaerales bacterium]|nr:hypothetical protein [Phycisphaerales bacterium]